MQIVTDINKFITTENKLYYPTDKKQNLKLINDSCIQNILNKYMNNCKFENNKQVIKVDIWNRQYNQPNMYRDRQIFFETSKRIKIQLCQY